MPKPAIHVLVLVGLAAFACAGCTAARRYSEDTVDRAALEAKVLGAERRIHERFVSADGLLVYRRRASEPPGPPVPPYGDHADTACWGGYLLGAAALRCAATGDAEAVAATDRLLGGIERLNEVTGIPGLFARTAEPDSPTPLRPRWRRAAIPGWRYRGGVSKDQYAGILFGLGCVLRHAPEGQLRNRAGALLVGIATHMDAGGLAIRDADGEVTTHGDLSPRYLGVPIAVNASLLLAAFRLSTEAGGPSAHRKRYRALVEDGVAGAASFAKVSVLGKTNRNNDHMATAGLYHLFALEDDPGVREQYRRGLARVARGVRGEENAYFLGLHMAASGRDPELAAEAWSALARLPAERRTAPLDLRGRVRGVVPIEMRYATAFLWRSDPYMLERDPEGTRPPTDYAPVDLVLAYWLLRAHGL